MAWARRRKYNKKTLDAARTVGFVTAAGAGIYGVLILFGVLPAAPLYKPEYIYAMGAVYVVLAIAQLIFRPRNAAGLEWLMALYYILLAIFMIFISGFTAVTFIFWATTLIVTVVLFRPPALFFGVIAMFASIIIGELLRSDVKLEALMLALFSGGVVSLTAASVFWLRSSEIIKTDIFEATKKRARTQRDRLSTVINSIGDALISSTGGGRVRIYNAAALALFDIDRPISGRRLDDVMNLSDAEGTKVELAKFLGETETPVERDDLFHTFPDGTKMRLMISSSPVLDAGGRPDGHTNGYILIIRDITRSKSLEEERDEFISVVSHELRTPVTIAEGALSNAQFLVSHGSAKSSLTDTLSSAHDQVMYLSKIVNDLSTLSRAERETEMDVEIIDVAEMMRGLREKYAPEAAKRNLELKLVMSPEVGLIKTNRLAVDEIMQNLIVNAIKYTVSGSVELIATRGTSTIHLAVRDTGIGISTSDQKHVFEKFWRSEDYRTRETSGTGLGLHIVRRLADRIGTKVTVESRLDRGSAFEFELPLYKNS